MGEEVERSISLDYMANERICNLSTQINFSKFNLSAHDTTDRAHKRSEERKSDVFRAQARWPGNSEVTSNDGSIIIGSMT